MTEPKFSQEEIRLFSRFSQWIGSRRRSDNAKAETIQMNFPTKTEKLLHARSNDLKSLRHSLVTAEKRAKRDIPGAKEEVKRLKALVKENEKALIELGVAPEKVSDYVYKP